MIDTDSTTAIELCERWWRGDATVTYEAFVAAQRALGDAGPQILDWCRSLLSRPDYEARETGAALIAELAQRGELGSAVEAVVDDLGRAFEWPTDDEPKSAQAVDATYEALLRLGTREDLRGVRAVLCSAVATRLDNGLDPVIETLESLTGEDFLSTDDPLAEARARLGCQTSN